MRSHTQVAEALLAERVIAILRGIRSPEAEGVVATLRRAGLRFVEITVESTGGIDTLAAARAAAGDEAFLGAGSILTAGQADDAVRAGAEYLVSPGFFEDVSD